MLRSDAEAERIKRYLGMPDLSRTPGSPIHEIVQRILSNGYFKDLDIIETPEGRAGNYQLRPFRFSGGSSHSE